MSFARGVRALMHALWVLCTLGSVACGANKNDRSVQPPESVQPRDVAGASSALPNALRTPAQIQSPCSQPLRIESVRLLSPEAAGPPEPQEVDAATPIVIAVGSWTLNAAQYAVTPPPKLGLVGPAYRWTLQL